MKRLLCLLMAAAYIFGYMGFGIHTCSDDGSRHFVWMLGDVSCEHIHHGDVHPGGIHPDADACEEPGQEHDHHAHGCCVTQVYVLTDAQDSVSDSHIPDMSENLAFALPETRHALSAGRNGAEMREGPSSPPVRIPVRSLLSVWRV